MADLICRWRNGTPKNVMEVVNSMPHHEMPEWQFKIFMNKSVWGNSFSRTVYQFASQLALYYISDDGVYHPRFAHDINEQEAKDYMERWLPRYYIPNPYVSSDGFNKIDCPTLFLKSLYDYVSKHPNCTYSEAYYECFHETAKNNDDIIRNYINNYSKVLIFHKGGMLSKTDVNPHIIFSEMDRNDKKAFFDFFFDVNKEDIKNELNNSSYCKFYTAIRTKPFLLLAGISGTGKSRIVRELAFMTCPKELQDEDGTTPGNYCMIEVKPNWHDSSELLGYYSSFNGGGYRFTKFDRFVVKAWLNPDVPFFVCLDEMNLAPVEEYFAEYLSVLESRKVKDGQVVSASLISKDVFKDEAVFEDLGLTVEDSSIKEDLKANGLRLPQNIVVIGTVNMDDTTNSFSRKVIDRAMTFETKIEEIASTAYFSLENDALAYKNIVCPERFICDEVRILDLLKDEEPDFQLDDDEKQAFTDFINEVNKAIGNGKNYDKKEGLGVSPFQISYRVLNEAVLYYRSLKVLYPAQASLDKVFNDILMMKVLPRIEGEQDRAKSPLEGLQQFVSLRCGDDEAKKEIWKESNDKIAYMLRPFQRGGDGFTTFWQ